MTTRSIRRKDTCASGADAEVHGAFVEVLAVRSLGAAGAVLGEVPAGAVQALVHGAGYPVIAVSVALAAESRRQEIPRADPVLTSIQGAFIAVAAVVVQVAGRRRNVLRREVLDEIHGGDIGEVIRPPVQRIR